MRLREPNGDRWTQQSNFFVSVVFGLVERSRRRKESPVGVFRLRPELQVMLGLAVASSARVRVVGQLVLKVKYCHPVFEEYAGVKERSLF